MYEPCHGSAPDIAGQGVANPLVVERVGRHDNRMLRLVQYLAHCCDDVGMWIPSLSVGMWIPSLSVCRPVTCA